MSFTVYPSQNLKEPKKKWWIRKHPFLTLILTFLTFSALSYWLSPDPDAGKTLIGVLPIEGAIFDSESIIKKLEILEKKEQVKGIIVRINSPGGGVAASQEIYDELKRVSKIKKMYASMSSLAASGGYYVALGAEKIYANPGTITGSIGVIMQFFNVQELMQKIGVTPVVIKAGENKDSGSMYRKMKPEEKAIFQGLIDNAREQFVSAIAKERKLDRAKLHAIADGRVFTGEQALQYGLVDDTAGFRDVVRTLKKDLKIQEEVEIYEPVLKKGTLIDLLEAKLGFSLPLANSPTMSGGLMAIWNQ